MHYTGTPRYLNEVCLLHFLFYLGFIMIAFSSALPVSALPIDTERQLIEARSPRYLFQTKDGKLSSDFVELLKLDGIYDPSDTFSQAVDKTQTRWLQSIAGQRVNALPVAGGRTTERFDLQDPPKWQAISDEVSAVAEKMGLFARRAPLLKHYTYGICLGATLVDMRDRIAELARMWKEENVRFDTLVILTGQRTDLRSDLGGVDGFDRFCDEKSSPIAFRADWKPPASIDEYKNTFKSEYDLACELIFKQLQLPDDMQAALQGKIIVVNAPKGAKLRPTTQDTYDVWLKTYSPQGTALAISSPVVWAGQAIVAEKCTRGTPVAVDTVASAVSQSQLDKYKEAKVILILDTVTKIGYELKAP